jgi:Fe/S biogenesis protein NfuA
MGDGGETASVEFEVTDAARDYVLAVRANEPDAEKLALFVDVVGARGLEFEYDLFFEKPENLSEDDLLIRAGDLPVVVPGSARKWLAGARLDYVGEDGRGELVIINPNKPRPVGVPQDATLDSELARKVARVIEEEINPAIASHGGRADLVGVSGSSVYVVLSGGCQGCAMSRITLTQGIEAAIKEAVPEVEDVIDVTDHAAGVNPYY